MKLRLRKIFMVLLSVLILLPNMNLSVFAVEIAEEDSPIISIPETSEWQGTVMGNVGGKDKITSENFQITEHEDRSVTMRASNDRGKIASSSEGIAYYFQEMDPDANFELAAKVKVSSFAANDQASFGIMLRSNVLKNESNDKFTGDYVAVGGIRQDMRGFYKYSEKNYQYPDDLDFDAGNPAVGREYELKIRKDGNVYQLSVNGEAKNLTNYSGEINYAGLFVSRNAKVTFSDIHLSVDGQVELGDWHFRAFGSNTSESKNPAPIMNDDGSITMSAKGGKIASGDEGISYFYKELPEGLNFILRSKARVISINGDSSISTPNQKSFGLMVRDTVGGHGDSSSQTSNYMAVGALDLGNESSKGMKAFYKKDSSQIKLNPFANVNIPAPEEEYTLSIKKSGSFYELSVNGETETVELENLFFETTYAGLYVARDAEVIFSDFEIIPETKQVEKLEITRMPDKLEYLIGEELDLTGLEVTAFYSDGTNEILAEDDYIVTGFDSSKAGMNTVEIIYGGQIASFDLKIIDLTITDLSIKYYPAKTDYYHGDKLDPRGLVVIAEYNDGYMEGELSSDQYDLLIEGESYENYIFQEPGSKIVTIKSRNYEITETFTVNVKEAKITGLEIKRKPEKTQYFIGDELDLSGLVVYANYDDGSSIRLLSNEYKVSGFDSQTAGDKAIIIEHKTKKAVFSVNVKYREVIGLEVTGYPQTTFYLGENFTHEGLEVSVVYDNGEKEELSFTDYVVDFQDFDNTKTGVYEICILPQEELDLNSISYKVTVKEKQNYEFTYMHFGQSTSDNRNRFEHIDDNTILLSAFDNGGKITGDHDGISFYYTVIDAEKDNFELSADIKVIEYAKEDHDGQESFGIMARDVIGTHGDSGVFSSNIAAVGGYSGGTKNPNGTQLFVRTGVLSPDGEGSQGIQNKMLKQERPSQENTHPNKTYRLNLKKTNSGFVGILNDGETTYEEIIYEPDILNVQDGDAYIGFYTARVATIEVSNIDLKVTAAETDAPREEPPAEAISPEMIVTSLKKTSDTDYRLLIDANVDGTITIKKGTENVAFDRPIKAGETFELMTPIMKNSFTDFSLVFIPDDTQYLTSYDPIIQNFTVENRIYEGEYLYVSPKGKASGEGSVESPLDLDTAIDFVRPGQTIYVMEGVYKRDSQLIINKYNDGKEGAMKKLWADPLAKTRPVIDFDKRGEGVVHSGSYWHVKGIDFARSAANSTGYRIGGSHNLIENLKTYENGDTGLQISRTDLATNIKDWPSYNTILNSESFDNADPSHNNADGFAAKLTSGYGNKFIGCVAHNNIDDGWDLYTKVGTGAIGPVLIENSIAYNNGFLTDGTIGGGDKNGFKLGGEGVHVPHIIKNSVAFGNGAVGFTSNSNPGVIAEDNFGFDNEGGNINFSTYEGIKTDFDIDGFISFHIKEISSKDSIPEQNQANINFLFDGNESKNNTGDVLPGDVAVQLAAITGVSLDRDGNIDWMGIWEVYREFLAQYKDNEEVPPIDPDEPKEPIEDPSPEDPEDPSPEDPEDPGPEDPKDPAGPIDDPKDPADVSPEDQQGTDYSDKGEALPNTASNNGNTLLIGLLFLAISLSAYLALRKKKKIPA